MIFAIDTHSALVAPLDPVEKLSMKRTVFFSKGIVVPPEVIITSGLWLLWAIPTSS